MTDVTMFGKPHASADLPEASNVENLTHNTILEAASALKQEKTMDAIPENTLDQEYSNIPTPSPRRTM